MDDERFQQRKDDYARAVTRLGEACAEPFSDLLRDSVIKRFEFCWELAWKMLKAWLEHGGVETNNPRDTFREALLQGLIQNGNLWSDMQKMRNLTSHTYDEALADEVYRFIVSQGLTLLTQLAETSQTWRMTD